MPARYRDGSYLSLLDPDAYRAAERIRLYHERWEIDRLPGAAQEDSARAPAS